METQLENKMTDYKNEILSKINNYCKTDGINPLSLADLENIVEKYPTFNLYLGEMLHGNETTPILKWLYQNQFINGSPMVGAMVIRDFIEKHIKM